MLPISSAATPALPPAPAVNPAPQANAAEAAVVVPADPAPTSASVVDLSPVAQFLSNVSQARQQLDQLQAAVANGAAPADSAEQDARLTDAAQRLVTGFNLLPAVDFNQGQPQGESLLNNLVQTLTRQNTTGNATQGSNAAQQLARIGLTLQAPLLSDAAGGLSLDSQVLRAAFSSDQQATTRTLRQTIDTFSQAAARFAQQVSAASTSATAALATAQQQALTAQDLAANARLDAARLELERLSRNADQESGADRLAAQRAARDQLANTPAEATPGPLSANPAQTPAAQTAAQQSLAVQEALNQANASQANAVRANPNPAGPPDPLRANPALAGAIAAYNINDTGRAAAGSRTAQSAVDAVQPVSRVSAVGAVDSGQPAP